MKLKFSGIKALTVYQPWATLIVMGAKPYEFRGWSPRERGGAYAALIGKEIVIHASARAVKIGEVRDLIARLKDPAEAWSTCLHKDVALPFLESCLSRPALLPLAAGLGTAKLGEPRDGWAIAEDFGMDPRLVNDSDREGTGNFGWPMLEIERWPEPVPMRGFQGFWNWPEPESVGL